MRAAFLGLALVPVLAAACRTNAVDLRGKRWIHAKLGYSIEVPRTAGAERGGWQLVSVPGADLAYRGPRGATMTLISECDRGAARPDLLARQLLIGLGDRELIESHPVALRGDGGWQQAFEVQEDGLNIEVRTVTVKSGTCTFDWLLVGPDGGEAESEVATATEDFERWWSSFRRDAPVIAAPPGAMGPSGARP